MTDPLMHHNIFFETEIDFLYSKNSGDDAGNYYTDTGADTGYDAPTTSDSDDAKSFDEGGDGYLNYSEFEAYAQSKGMTDPDVIEKAFTDRGNGDHSHQGIAAEDASQIVDTYIGGQFDT